MSDADQIIQRINAAPWTRRRAIRQALIAQRDDDLRRTVRTALHELASPSGIRGAEAIARMDLAQAQANLSADLNLYATIINHPQADDETVTMARAVRSDLCDLLITVTQSVMMA